MAIGALPQNLPNTLNQLAIRMDEIWHLAGDRATDVSSTVPLRGDELYIPMRASLVQLFLICLTLSAYALRWYRSIGTPSVPCSAQSMSPQVKRVTSVSICIAARGANEPCALVLATWYYHRALHAHRSIRQL